MGQRQHWHHQSAHAVIEHWQTSATGLSDQAVASRQRRYGANRLPTPPPQSRFLRFLRQFHNILIYVLLASALITGTLGHGLDTAVILAVVLLNAVIGYVQEGKAARAIMAIRHMLALQASVIRNGRRHSVAGEQLVPGDVVLLDAGDKVPADLRLFKAHSLQIQEAILTGESVAVDKQVAPVSDDAALADRSCMAFSGTTVTSGQGSGVVVATGVDTEVGQISGMLADVETLKTPLIEQMAVFARWLTLVIVVIAGLLLAYGHLVQQQAFAGLFMAVVGLSVAAIPEGLPAVLTITLAVGVQAMARRHAIVRRLPAIETVGAVSVICTDKTGTLTRNEMSVATVVAGGRLYSADDAGYAPIGSLWLEGQEVAADAVPSALQVLIRTAVLCNDAELRKHEDDWQVEGDPMEGALLALAGKADLYPADLRRQWRRTDIIPFDTDNRFMATLNHDHEGHGSIYLKGAPESVLALCDRQLAANGDVVPLEADHWHRQAEQTAADGQRVLAFAFRPVAASQAVIELADLQQKLVMIGLAGFIDPPREEAVAAVAECQSAGIDVKMITGDHASTAAAIGQQLGLPNTHRTLTGAELDRLSDEELADVAAGANVFARTSPEHKLRLVKALQSQGMTVAMTGDGVNDAPALRRADIGIAMGRKGTEAAKEVSDLVLADDNFASIVAAVREGRTVRDNIRKMIGWTLPTSSGEACAIVVALLEGFYYEPVHDALKAVGDMERILARVALRSARPRDLARLRDAFAALPELQKTLAPISTRHIVSLAATIGEYPDHADLLERAIIDNPPVVIRDGGVIRDGFDSDLDELRNISENAGQYLLDVETRERERTGISTLKVGYNRVHGYYIEISRAQSDQAPVDYIRRQTLKNAERFITPELKVFEDKALSAKSRALAREKALYDEILETLAATLAQLQDTAQALAELDVLANFAERATSLRFCAPEFRNEPGFDVEDGRHPVVEQLLSEPYVPNNLLMDNKRRMLVITGPNMGGKSTYMRQAALIALLAYTGSYVPANRAVLGPVDRIFTRMGSSDDIAGGRSTFMVEMTETANILHNATEHSLVLMDEVGRGTSTFDGLSLAWATADHLARNIRCYTLFATHYFELTQLAEDLDHAVNVHLTATEHDDSIVFLHNVHDGPASQSYGLQVAKLAGVPQGVILNAKAQLSQLEGSATPAASGREPQAAVLAAAPVTDSPAFQGDMFSSLEPSEVEQTLSSLDLDDLTPRDALNQLYELKKMLKA